jgi:hypothetical protein
MPLRTDEFAPGVCHDFSVEKNRLATAYRSNDGTGEFEPDIRTHFMALEQVCRFQRIRTGRIQQQEICVIPHLEGAF